MAFTTLPGQSLWYPDFAVVTTVPAYGNVVIDATGEKASYVGRVWYNGRASTKNITKVGFRFGAVTKAGGSALTVSLQDVNLTAGAPIQPDETQDQTVAIANANAAFATNTWIQTGALSANRTVSFGELLAVVIEYDGAGRLGADSVQVTYLQSNHVMQQGTVVLKTAGWALGSNAQPAVILEFDDNSFGTLTGGFPSSNMAAQTFKSDTAGADEYALRFQVPFPCKVDGAVALMSAAANTGDFDMILYDGTSAMSGGSVSIDANAMGLNNSDRVMMANFSQQVELAANHTYYMAIKPTQTTSNASLRYIDVSAANHFQAMPGGVECYEGKRIDAGAWTDTTTRRPLIAVLISALDDGAGSGGAGPLIGPGRLIR